MTTVLGIHMMSKPNQTVSDCDDKGHMTIVTMMQVI